MGEDRPTATYVGLLTREGKLLQSVRMASGEDSAAFLGSLSLKK